MTNTKCKFGAKAYNDSELNNSLTNRTALKSVTVMMKNHKEAVL